MFRIKDNGLGEFQELTDKYGFDNYITVDNEIWGNMHPQLADTEDEKLDIIEKDKRLLDIYNPDFSFITTTPLDADFSIINKEKLSFSQEFTPVDESLNHKYP